MQKNNLYNLSVYGIGQAFNLITPLIVIPYIIAVCGLANYGRSAVAMALLFFLIVFVDYGSDIIGVKAVATNRDKQYELGRIFTTTYCAKFCMLILILGVMAVLFLFVPNFADDSALYFLSLPILIGQFLNPTWYLQGLENFKVITIVNVLSKCIYLIGIFSFINQPSDYIYINLWWGIGMIVANGCCFLWLIHKNRFEFRALCKDDISIHLKEGFPIFSSQIFVAIQLYSPLMLVGFLGGAVLAGTYRVVDQIIVIFKTYILLFFNFVFPRVCYLLGDSLAKGVRYWLLFNGANFIFILISMAVVYGFSSDVVAFFTDSHRDGITDLLKIAILIPILMSVSVPLKQLVLGMTYNSFYVNTTIAISLANVIAMIVMLSLFGLPGVLISLILAEATTAMLFYLKINKPLFLPQK